MKSPRSTSRPANRCAVSRGFGLTQGEGDIAVRPGVGTLLVGGNVGRITEIDPATGRLVGNYDPLSNTQLGTTDVRQQGVGFQAPGTDITGLACDKGGQRRAATSSGRVFNILLPAAPISFGPTGVLIASLDGTPADSLKPAANVGQAIRINGSITIVSRKSSSRRHCRQWRCRLLSRAFVRDRRRHGHRGCHPGGGGHRQRA